MEIKSEQPQISTQDFKQIFNEVKQTISDYDDMKGSPGSDARASIIKSLEVWQKKTRDEQGHQLSFYQRYAQLLKILRDDSNIKIPKEEWDEADCVVAILYAKLPLLEAVATKASDDKKPLSDAKQGFFTTIPDTVRCEIYQHRSIKELFHMLPKSKKLYMEILSIIFAPQVREDRDREACRYQEKLMRYWCANGIPSFFTSSNSSTLAGLIRECRDNLNSTPQHKRLCAHLLDTLTTSANQALSQTNANTILAYLDDDACNLRDVYFLLGMLSNEEVLQLLSTIADKFKQWEQINSGENETKKVSKFCDIALRVRNEVQRRKIQVKDIASLTSLIEGLISYHEKKDLKGGRSVAVCRIAELLPTLPEELFEKIHNYSGPMIYTRFLKNMPDIQLACWLLEITDGLDSDNQFPREIAENVLQIFMARFFPMPNVWIDKLITMSLKNSAQNETGSYKPRATLIKIAAHIPEKKINTLLQSENIGEKLLAVSIIKKTATHSTIPWQLSKASAQSLFDLCQSELQKINNNFNGNQDLVDAIKSLVAQQTEASKYLTKKLLELLNNKTPLIIVSSIVQLFCELLDQSSLKLSDELLNKLVTNALVDKRDYSHNNQDKLMHPLHIIIKISERSPWQLNDRQIANLIDEYNADTTGREPLIGKVIINLLAHGRLKPDDKRFDTQLVLLSGKQLEKPNLQSITVLIQILSHDTYACYAKDVLNRYIKRSLWSADEVSINQLISLYKADVGATPYAGEVLICLAAHTSPYPDKSLITRFTDLLGDKEDAKVRIKVCELFRDMAKYASCKNVSTPLITTLTTMLTEKDASVSKAARDALVSIVIHTSWQPSLGFGLIRHLHTSANYIIAGLQNNTISTIGHYNTNALDTAKKNVEESVIALVHLAQNTDWKPGEQTIQKYAKIFSHYDHVNSNNWNALLTLLPYVTNISVSQACTLEGVDETVRPFVKEFNYVLNRYKDVLANTTVSTYTPD